MADAIRRQRGLSPTDLCLSGQSQLAPDDARDETVVGARAVSERSDTGPDRVTLSGVSVLDRLHAVGGVVVHGLTLYPSVYVS